MKRRVISNKLAFRGNKKKRKERGGARTHVVVGQDAHSSVIGYGVAGDGTAQERLALPKRRGKSLLEVDNRDLAGRSGYFDLEVGASRRIREIIQQGVLSRVHSNRERSIHIQSKDFC